jgi:hypothetical protein
LIGFETARAVVKLGRTAFFPEDAQDLPQRMSPILGKDDLAPQFGYVGEQYARGAGVLLLGINPGNGPYNDRRTRNDERMMPAILQFAANPTEQNFAAASRAYKLECEMWPVWKQHCKQIIGAGKLQHDEIAYSNSLPCARLANPNSAMTSLSGRPHCTCVRYSMSSGRS